MAKEDGNEVGKVEGEYSQPNAAAAFKHHKDHIAPKLAKIDTLKGECSEPWQHIKKHTHMPRPVMNFLLNIEGIEDDAKQQHHIDALFDGLEALGLSRTPDLVTMSQGASDLPGLEDDDDFEASPEEIAKQKARPSTEKAKADKEAAAEKSHGSKPTHGDVKMAEAVH